MGGFCGVISREDCVTDLFFGIDYHSHLGTHRGGMAVLEPEGKFLRAIHNIQNAPFRTKFEQDFARFRGHAGLGVISDTDPQPLVMESHLGVFALVTVGLVANMEALKNELFENRHAQLQYSTTSGALGQTELVSAIIASQDTIVDGLRRVQAVVEGSLSLLLVTAALLLLSDNAGKIFGCCCRRRKCAEADAVSDKGRRNGISYWQAFVVGLGQAIAVIPGLSRSGTTIATGLLCGVKRDVVAQFSFLMVLIPILGEAFLEIVGGDMASSTVGALPLVLGFISAFVAGLFACRVMIALVKKTKLGWFALYCAVVAVLIFIFA